MASTSEKVLQIRQMLDERFGKPGLAQKTTYQTGLPVLDQAEVPKGAITEIVSTSTEGPGGVLFLYGLLHETLQKGNRVALIDANDSFQPKGLLQPDLDRLLWARCHNADEAIKATDLVVRDGNLPLVILLVSLSSLRELRRIPSTTWHRLQMLAEKSAVTLLVLTPYAQVGCAQLRLEVGGGFPLQIIHRNREELVPALNLNITRRRMSHERGCIYEDLRRPVCA